MSRHIFFLSFSFWIQNMLYCIVDEGQVYGRKTKCCKMIIKIAYTRADCTNSVRAYGRRVHYETEITVLAMNGVLNSIKGFKWIYLHIYIRWEKSKCIKQICVSKVMWPITQLITLYVENTVSIVSNLQHLWHLKHCCCILLTNMILWIIAFRIWSIVAVLLLNAKWLQCLVALVGAFWPHSTFFALFWNA